MFRCCTLVVLLTLTLSAIGAAQVPLCPISDMAFASYGQGCSPFFQEPTLSGSYDSSACTLTLNLTSSPSCCNTFRTGRFLIVGDNPAATPLPMFGANCTLLAQADLILELGPLQPDAIVIPVPPWVQPGLDVYLQGANSFFTTIGFTTDVEFSNGLQLTTI